MKNIPFWGTDYNRRVAKTAQIELKNRLFERNPVQADGEAVSVISRPGMVKFADVGDGPIRKVYSSPGTFDGDLFVVSGTGLHRVLATDLSSTYIGELGTVALGDVSMCTTAPIGDVPAYLYIAEGGVLWVYTENGHSSGHLQASGAIANGDVVRIDSVYYQFTTGSVDTGTPAGTLANPWLVAIGAGNAIAFENLYNALTATGVAGTDYSTALTAHTTVHGTNYNSTDFYVEAIEPGAAGDVIVTTETGANLAWDAGTLANGGTDQLRQVFVPDDAGAISVAHINSYVVVVPVQSADIKGRFYWINPGENTIEALDFATAERNPDGVHQVIVFGDMFWLLGENTTEPWITTGDAAAPMERYKGILFDRGSWEGTATQVKDSLIVVDEDGGVFQISGGQKRISRPDIEERIRLAIAAEAIFNSLS